ncbi:alpha/beta fold hydrolase [Streptomyces stramineus]
MPYLDVNDTTLYIEDEGSGPALLFLHGWGTSGRVWGGQLREFVRDHRVVTVDGRGCGRSARPAGATPSTVRSPISWRSSARWAWTARSSSGRRSARSSRRSWACATPR